MAVPPASRSAQKLARSVARQRGARHPGKTGTIIGAVAQRESAPRTGRSAMLRGRAPDASERRQPALVRIQSAPMMASRTAQAMSAPRKAGADWIARHDTLHLQKPQAGFASGAINHPPTPRTEQSHAQDPHPLRRRTAGCSEFRLTHQQVAPAHQRPAAPRTQQDRNARPALSQ